MAGKVRSFRRIFVAVIAAFALSAVAQQRSSEPVSGLIHLKTGIALDYIVQGKSDGPVIVFLHGAGDSWHSYERVLPLLPAEYRVYAVTLRGHGMSDHPETGYQRKDFAADILDFLDQLKIHHATLVGHSLGSFVAQKTAELDTDHLSRLVLIGSGPGVAKSSQAVEEIRKSFAAIQDPVPYTFARDFQASTVYSPIPAWFFERMVGEALRVPASTWHGLGEGVTAQEPVEELKKIHVPTLIFWGDKDSIFSREDQDVLLKVIPHSSLKTYPETGHALHWERPEEFAQDLLKFIATTPAS